MAWHGRSSPVDDHDDLAAHDDAHLLVRMRVRGHDGAGLELDEVEHRCVAEERAGVHARGERERFECVETQDARCRHGGSMSRRRMRRPARCSALRNAFAVQGCLL
jgi:hypothetical protein